VSVGWGSGVGPQAVAIVNNITAIIKKQYILYMRVLSVYCSAVYHCCGTGGATGLTKQNPRPVQSGGQVEKPLARLTRGLSYGALAIALTPFLEGPQSAAGAGLLALLANGLWLIADSSDGKSIIPPSAIRHRLFAIGQNYSCGTAPDSHRLPLSALASGQRAPRPRSILLASSITQAQRSVKRRNFLQPRLLTNRPILSSASSISSNEAT
jgi:hypothetical protein